MVIALLIVYIFYWACFKDDIEDSKKYKQYCAEKREKYFKFKNSGSWDKNHPYLEMTFDDDKLEYRWKVKENLYEQFSSDLDNK